MVDTTDDAAPGLEVGFAIATGGAFAELLRFSQMFDDKTVQFVRQAAKVEAAVGGMVKLGPAVAEVTSWGNAHTRAGQQVARAKAQVERSSEQLIRRLDREAVALGQTKEQMLEAQVEAVALAASTNGLTEAADRLLVSMRNRKAVMAELDENKAVAADRAAADAARERAQAEQLVLTQLREREQLEAALADHFGVGRASATQAGATFSALAERERELELAEKQIAATRQQNNLLAERASIEAALERNTGFGRPKATDAGATFSALAAKAAEDEARAQDLAAAAVKRAGDEHARLAALVRGSNAAQEADAAAAERMRAATDPLYATTKRLNDEIAESTRLYRLGATAPAEYARQQEVLAGRLRATTVVHDELTAAGRRGAGSMAQLSFQINDVVTMAALGAKPMQIFASQAGQIVQIAQMHEGGMRGFGKEVGSLALRFAPLAAVAAVAGVAIWRFQEQVSKDADLKKYADGLGLTHKEMKKLGDVSVTTGDLMSGLWKTIQDRMGMKFSGKKLIDYLFSPDDAKQVGNFIAEVYGLFVGGYKGIVAVWGMLPAAMKDLLIQAVNATAAGVEGMVNKSIGAINALAKRANDLLGVELFGQIAEVSVARMQNDAAGAAKKVVSTFTDSIRQEKANAAGAMAGFFSDVGKNAGDAARARLKKKADEIIADRTPKKDKPDRHAETLAREAEAIEAQIRNLYQLADAYRVSAAAALIAEARVKAESEAIKKRGDVEAFVDRQVRLAVAQRVSDAAKATAALREQAGIQEEVNRAVITGLVPAERAADLVRDRLAELPLVAAMGAAAARGDAEASNAALRALNEQRAARERLTAAEQAARVASAMATGNDRLAELREELRLVGETEAVRALGLARLRAEQEAKRLTDNPAKQAEYVAQQMQIANLTQQLLADTSAYNEQLTSVADKWDIIAGKVQSAAQGLGEAFGPAGAAIGQLASIYASYQAQRTRAELEHKRRVDEIGKDQVRLARENERFALSSAGAQVAAFGDAAAAAKGFFKEGSSGYKALQKAEQTFRAIQFALSVRAIAQDAIETGTALAKSAARTAAHAVEAVAKALASLPFPANLAAGAATVAALAAIGVSIAGAFGSGGKKPAAANEGTGTVLGDPSAKSASIRNALDALKQVDTLMLSSSREMAASLKSIDSQISGFAAQILKAGNINASDGIQTGFKMDTTGSLLKGIITGGGLLTKIPVIGGIIGAVGSIIGSLFGSKTQITGTGLYGGAQSLGGILQGGFDASYYSDVKKTKKFLGITTGTSYSTQYSGADPTLENQFTLILRSFNDAIAAAAEPLGESTAAIEQRLAGFVVNIGKIDLTGLTGEQITEKLTAVFGAAADQMATSAFPGIERFQKAGEGAFETLVRVASTVEATSAALDQLGATTRNLSIDAKLGLAGQFDSISGLTNAVDAYFKAFYTAQEQSAAKAAQFARVFDSLGVAAPATLAAFRQLVEAQDLTTAAGQATYATLLQLAPAFAELQESMAGAKSAADIISERQDLERQLLELKGDTAAIRALDLAKLDASNRGLQQQVWAMQDAQKAAQAADELRKAWSSVGDSIMDEVKRIRGLNGAGDGSFAALQGRFNAATTAARAGDQDAAKNLPALSQALLTAAALVATSRQELDRVQAATAASLEATKAVIDAFSAAPDPAETTAALVSAAAATQAANSPTAAANDDTAEELRALREEVAGLRSESRDGLAANASANNRTARVLENVTGQSGGDAISVVQAA